MRYEAHTCRKLPILDPEPRTWLHHLAKQNSSRNYTADKNVARVEHSRFILHGCKVARRARGQASFFFVVVKSHKEC